MSRRRASDDLSNSNTSSLPPIVPNTPKKSRRSSSVNSANGRRGSITSEVQNGRSAPEKGHRASTSNRAGTPSKLGNGHTPQNGNGSVTTLLVDEPHTSKYHNLFIRSTASAVMVGGFLLFLLAGHSWVIFLVAIIQLLVYREVISLSAVTPRERKLPWMRAINWYFLLATNYFLYGESIIHYFRNTVYTPAYRVLLPLATHHRFISFALYCGGFVWFVMNLRKHHYRFQIQAFGWTHMTLLLVVVQSHFIINNILEGLIWFVLPVSLVVVNDIAAYICGFLWGRTPLISLSPKKTWEGFIGAFIITFVFGFWYAGFLAQFGYMVCPARDLHTTSLSGMDCQRNAVFLEHGAVFPSRIVHLLGILLAPLGIKSPEIFLYYPIQLHTVILSCFASLIAPFGGFFASGVKRAFKIKDFGDSIPGHGGITDRMDCQFLMGLFSYMYYQSFISPSSITVSAALRMLMHLKPQQQLEIYQNLQHQLSAHGLLDESTH